MSESRAGGRCRVGVGAGCFDPSGIGRSPDGGAIRHYTAAKDFAVPRGSAYVCAAFYVTDSDNDIFMDTKSQQYYTLLAGRWFRAKSLEGGWEWVAGSQLPHDFTRISPESPKGHVLASIPGTER
jgi:hypothetical protein